MNKTLSIGLAGFSFTIEEHAYIKLSDYLDALRNSLGADEADEVMHDIEIRMVEIFRDSLGRRDVLNNDDVEKVIAQLGRPEQIEEQEETYFSEKTTKASGKYSDHRNRRQLFRDPSRAKIGGVCAGMAHYFGIDVTLLRAILLGLILMDIFLTFAISTSFIVLLYIVLWIVLPKAQTASDYLKMKGKPVNFDTLKEESSKIVQFANESTQKVGEIYQENHTTIKNAGNGIWNAFRYIFGTIFAIMGLSLLIGSFAMFGVYDGSNVDFFENVRFYLQENNAGILLISLAFLTVFIPALIFLFIALKLFSPRTKLNNAGYVFGALVILWIGLAAFGGFSAVRYATQFSGHNEETENIAINTSSDSLLVDVKKVSIPQNFKSYWANVFSDGKTIYKQDYPDIDVSRKDVKAPYLEIRKRADGYNLPLKVQIPVEISGNKLMFPNYISYPYEYRFRDYRVDYELVVPKHMKVIALNNERGFYLDDHSEDTAQTAGSSQNTVTIQSGEHDSIIVNGKKVSKTEAENMIKDLGFDSDSIKNVNISIKKGEKEISIKTE